VSLIVLGFFFRFYFLFLVWGQHEVVSFVIAPNSVTIRVLAKIAFQLSAKNRCSWSAA